MDRPDPGYPRPPNSPPQPAAEAPTKPETLPPIESLMGSVPGLSNVDNGSGYPLVATSAIPTPAQLKAEESMPIICGYCRKPMCVTETDDGGYRLLVFCNDHKRNTMIVIPRRITYWTETSNKTVEYPDPFDKSE